MKLKPMAHFLLLLTSSQLHPIKFPCHYERDAITKKIETRPEFKKFLPAIFPMFSLGNRMMPKGRFAAIERYVYQKNDNSHASIAATAFRYGVTDYLTVRGDLPLFLDRMVGKKHADGASNLLGVAEYSIIKNRVKPDKEYQATLLGGIGFPTISKTTPAVGYNGWNFLLGTTGSSLSKHWYGFYSLATIVSTEYKKQNPGAQFLYEVGCGLVLKHSVLQNICVLLEMDGIYSEKDYLGNTSNPHSGGNIIYLGPSIEYRYWNFLGAAGIQLPIVHDLNGTQDKRQFRFSCLGLFVF